MTAQIIPTGDDPHYIETVTLDGVPYLLQFDYNQREDRWWLAIFTVDGDPIYGSVKLVPNWPLFAQCVDARLPPGQFIVVSSSATDDSPPGLEELVDGARCSLVYVPAADVAAVLAAPAAASSALLASQLSQATGSGAAPVAIDGMLALLPGLTVHTTGSGGPTSYTCASAPAVSVTIGGDPTYQYTVAIRIRGVVEQKTVTGGAPIPGTGGLMVLGGTPAGDNSNVYSLAVSSPAQTYYLNAGTSGGSSVEAIDYDATIAVMGGAVVTLTLTSVDSIELANTTDGTGGNPAIVPNIAAPAQPYAGQFVLLSVGRVT